MGGFIDDEIMRACCIQFEIYDDNPKGVGCKNASEGKANQGLGKKNSKNWWKSARRQLLLCFS